MFHIREKNLRKTKRRVYCKFNDTSVKNKKNVKWNKVRFYPYKFPEKTFHTEGCRKKTNFPFKNINVSNVGGPRSFSETRFLCIRSNHNYIDCFFAKLRFSPWNIPRCILAKTKKHNNVRLQKKHFYLTSSTSSQTIIILMNPLSRVVLHADVAVGRVTYEIRSLLYVI